MKIVYSPSARVAFNYIADAAGADAKNGIYASIIVPDRMSVTGEDLLARRLEPRAQLYCEALSFRQFANSVFRRYGGLSYSYADKTVRTLLMWRAIRECSPLLKIYGSLATDPASAAPILDAISELKRSRITPDALAVAAMKLGKRGGDDNNSDNSFPADKYADIANIYAVYDDILSKSFDDPETELTKLAELLSKNGADFFNNRHLYVYGHASFSHQQLDVLRYAEMYSQNTTVAFLAPAEAASARGAHIEYEAIADTTRRLRRIADEAGSDFEIIELPGDDSVPAMLAGKLWDMSEPRASAGSGNAASGEGKEDITDNKNDSIKIYECPDRRAEAEAAAIEIIRAVMGGMRYRDILVCAASVESYRGIIEDVFDAYGIPYHITARTRLETKPQVAFLLSALRIVTGGWRRQDIIAYMRTGLTCLTDDEADELELYITQWRIDGSRFHSPVGGAWSMNPDGYTATWTEEGTRLLTSVNASREKIAEPLLHLADAMSGAKTAKEKSNALRAFLLETKVLPEDLGGAREGAAASEQEDAQLARLIDAALAAVDICAPEGPVTAAEYMGCLSLALGTLDIGTIPTRADEVDIGDAARMRSIGCRMMIMLGCCDGEFPAPVSDDGFFTDSEKAILEGEGISIYGDTHIRASAELYNFAFCASLSSERLIMTYRKNGTDAKELPSAAIERTLALMPGLKPICFTVPTEPEFIYSEKTAATYFTRMSGSTRLAVERILSDDAKYKGILDAVKTPISAGAEQISDEVAKELFGGNISLSQSRLESFVMCHFGFYCTYILGLREKKRAELGYADVGTFVHAILERVFSSGMLDEENLSDEEIEKAAAELVAAYISDVCPKEEAGKPRLLHLFRRLSRSVVLFIREFYEETRQSCFRTVLCEAPIGMKGRGDREESSGVVIDPIEIPLEDGGVAKLRGIADRIDAYRAGDGTVWVRVVDYKTGSKKFNPDDLKLGLSLQLPIYLYSIINSKNPALLSLLGVEEDVSGGADNKIKAAEKVKPAGFLYIGTAPADIQASDDEEGAGETISAPMVRSGLLVMNEEILRAMDADLKGRFIPVKLKQDGTPYAQSQRSLAEPTEFMRRFDELRGTIARISAEMKRGDAKAYPLVRGGKSPCDYCEVKPVCRRANHGTGR